MNYKSHDSLQVSKRVQLSYNRRTRDYTTQFKIR